MCHFYICIDINGQKDWADYLFTNLSQAREKVIIRQAASASEIEARLVSGRGDVTLSENAGKYHEGDAFKSFHHQTRHPFSPRAVLAGFLSVWLKKCVVPSAPRENISPVALSSAVRLVFKKPLGLLPAMVCNIQHGLRALTVAFCK